MIMKDKLHKYSMNGYNDLVKEFKNESDRSVIIVAVS